LNNTDGTPVLGPPVTGTINPHLYHNVKYNLLIHYCEIIKSFNRFHHLVFFLHKSKATQSIQLFQALHP
jgi:hypothetical protein